VEQLRGRTAVVTGAASGIGLAVADVLLREGMNVAMADLDEAGVQQQADRLAQAGGQVHAVRVDVRDAEAVERLGQEVVERFGGLHIAVNNAGIAGRGVTWELTLEDWRRVLDVNLWGVIHGIRAFVPRILATGEPGHVVNTGSMASVVAHRRLGPYTVAKHGVLGLSDVLRADLRAAGAPVGVSVVLPGAIRTGMNPYGSVTAEQVAANVLDAIRRDRAYVFTDDHSTDDVQARLGAILDARDEVIA
jgi:NAD(P)-dependent dehydrogenase (short-subunit alcohol dehydrogenase family)